jgi:hypothetical protein
MKPKRKPGRPPIHEAGAMTPAELMRRYYARLRRERYFEAMAGRPEARAAAERCCGHIAEALRECPNLTVDDIRAAITARFGPRSPSNNRRSVVDTAAE